MSKKKIVTAGAAVLVILGVVIFLVLRNQTAPLITPLSQLGIPSETKTGELLLYEDEAGFAFEYPETLGIVEKDISDPQIYSSLELLAKNYPEGKITIKITDTDFTSIEKWLAKNPQEGNLVTSTEINFGGMKGKSFSYTQPAKNLILVIDSGILYFLEAPSDGSFWDEAFGAVSSSFQLTEGKTTSSGGAPAPIVEEGEEIIE